MKKVMAVFWIVIGLSIAFGGIKEFDSADTLIEFLRGLFWLIIGLFVFELGKRDYKKS